jgi:hypothetical protein
VRQVVFIRKVGVEQEEHVVAVLVQVRQAEVLQMVQVVDEEGR